MPRMPKSISDVVATQLCTGCGACAYIEPLRFTMADTLEHGRRPFVRKAPTEETGDALLVCPGAGLTRSIGSSQREGLLADLFDAWGPVYGVWEGYAADADIRFSGSSGGAATAFALYCLEREGMAAVLHTAARKDAPVLNETVLSVNRAELLARAGSRYAPASPADGLELIEAAEGPCVFIGKPCDAAAVHKARKQRRELDQKLGLVIAFFCAGVPSTKGNLELLKANGVGSPRAVKELRYRGRGWPGMWSVSFETDEGNLERRELTYSESWGFLQRYRQWRCYICPDHTGEFADIAVGDPWYRQVQANEPGKSLIVARTPRGKALIEAAARDGYIVLEREDASLLPRSQPNLLKTRGNIWARLIVLKLFGVPVPKFRGFSQFRFWVQTLGTREKVQAFFSTPKRIFAKDLRKRIAIQPWAHGDDR